MRQGERTLRAKLKSSARELFAIEQAFLKPLLVWVPPVYLLHQPIVDVEGYVSVATNRYSVPVEMIGRRVELRESKDTIEIWASENLVFWARSRGLEPRLAVLLPTPHNQRITATVVAR